MKNIVKRILCSAMVAVSAVFAGSFASAIPDDSLKEIVVQFQVPVGQPVPIQTGSKGELVYSPLWREKRQHVTVEKLVYLPEPLVNEGVRPGCVTYAVVLKYYSNTIDLLHPTLAYSPFGVSRDATLDFNNLSIDGKKCDETPEELIKKVIEKSGKYGLR